MKHCTCDLCHMNRQWNQAVGKKNIKRMVELYNEVWGRMANAETEIAMADYKKVKNSLNTGE